MVKMMYKVFSTLANKPEQLEYIKKNDLVCIKIDFLRFFSKSLYAKDYKNFFEELEIKKVLDQRNYDIEQVTKNLNKSNADTWLKPQETSLKSEKPSPINKPIINSNNQNKLKYIIFIEYFEPQT
mgnify:CR=1 FL=1